MILRTGFATTAPVMTYNPNPRGLYGMAGNAWEWTESWLDSSRTSMTLRGGSWNNYKAENLRSTTRSHRPQDYRSATNGFRIVLVPEGGAAPASGQGKTSTTR